MKNEFIYILTFFTSNNNSKKSDKPQKHFMPKLQRTFLFVIKTLGFVRNTKLYADMSESQN